MCAISSKILTHSEKVKKKKKKRHRGGESGFKFPQPSTKFQPGCDQEQKHIHVDPFQEGDKTDKTKKHRKTMVLPSGYVKIAIENGHL